MAKGKTRSRSKNTSRARSEKNDSISDDNIFSSVLAKGKAGKAKALDFYKLNKKELWQLGVAVMLVGFALWKREAVMDYLRKAKAGGKALYETIVSNAIQPAIAMIFKVTSIPTFLAGFATKMLFPLDEQGKSQFRPNLDPARGLWESAKKYPTGAVDRFRTNWADGTSKFGNTYTTTYQKYKEDAAKAAAEAAAKKEAAKAAKPAVAKSRKRSRKSRKSVKRSSRKRKR